MKKSWIVVLCFCLVGECFAAKLCGKVSRNTKWHGGVFSIIEESGRTIATTPYIVAGNQGCTDSFKPGTYLIRFNGALENNKPMMSEEIYGCLTAAPYAFDETTLYIVFNEGTPPFNGNSFCTP